ncbi:MAG TPA: hypothetical protein VGB30_14525 [bacterium]|jgi:hypothetical protein
MKNEKKSAISQMDKILKAKIRKRVELANLPFPEKVKIVAKLQGMSNGLIIASGRKPKRAWKV